MSLRGRLVLAVSAVALVALLVADLATYSALRSFLYSRVDQSLLSSVIPLQHREGAGLVPGLPPRRFQSGLGREPGPLGTRSFFELRSPSGAVVQGPFAAYQADGMKYSPRLPSTITGFEKTPEVSGSSVYFDAPSNASAGPRFRVLAVRQTNGYVIILAGSLADADSTLQRLLLIELAVTVSALLAAIVLGWWLVRVGLRPLAGMEDTADAIAAGELDQRVPGENVKTEVGRLARALNMMLGRIEGAFAARDATESELRRSEGRLRQFVADASHELRTPIAAVSAYAELFERGAREHPDDLARVVTGIRSETERMGHLVEDLLLLARLDEGRPLGRDPVELVALAGEAVRTATTVGPAWPVVLRAERPVEVIGDSLRLRQVLDNLFANVRAHTPEGTTATVRISESGPDAVMEVADDGPGLAEGEMRHVFERFYRSDPSRSRTKGGAGLGLSIVAAIVGAHGGRVSVAARPGGGTRFTVHLPAGETSTAPAGPAGETSTAPAGPAGERSTAPAGPDLRPGRSAARLDERAGVGGALPDPLARP